MLGAAKIGWILKGQFHTRIGADREKEAKDLKREVSNKLEELKIESALVKCFKNVSCDETGSRCF